MELVQIITAENGDRYAFVTRPDMAGLKIDDKRTFSELPAKLVRVYKVEQEEER
jgi:hypothetical protein